jgi:WD40 repeat protein
MITEATETFAEIGTPPNPFPGLRPFEFDESHLFFGRDGQSEQLISKLGRTRFLAVVGTSGSGKSSLVRAGLLPTLLGGFMTSAGSDWRIAIMRPGSDPVGNLAEALNAGDVFGSEIEENAAIQTAIAEATLRRGNLGLVDAVRQAAMPENENLLVLVDQFEEIFRFARVSEGEAYHNDAAAFVKLILEASQQREIPIYVVLTMRSDYLGDCSQFWDLPEAINESQYLIPRLTRDQLREAITGPAAVGLGSITPRLVNRLLNDVGDDQDQLPILQHALMRSWDEWRRGSHDHQTHKDEDALDLCCYQFIGGMAEALSRHADEAFNELAGDRSREVAGKLFKCLTEKGADNREIRRPTMLSEICAVVGATAAEAIGVIETFRQTGRSFFMPPAGLPLDSKSLIDISHESLIRGWQRLSEWVNEEARSSRVYRRLAETAELNEAGKAGLWRDPDLQLALDWREEHRPNRAWAQRYHPEFDRAIAFLNESQRVRDTEVKDKERKRKRAYVITIVLGFVFLALSLFALRQTREAELEKSNAERLLMQANEAQANADSAQRAAHVAQEEARVAQEKVEGAQHAVKDAELQIAKEKAQTTAALREAESEKLRAQGISQEAKSQRQQADALKLGGYARVTMDETSDGLVQSLLLATESLKSSWTPEGYEMAANGINFLPRSVPFPQFALLPRSNQRTILGIAYSNNGHWIATVDGGSLIVRDVDSGRELEFPNVSGGGEPYAIAIAFSPDDRWVAVGGMSGASVWNTSSWQMRKLVPNGDYVYSVAFSPDSQFLAIGARSDGERVYQTSTWNELPLAKRENIHAAAVAFSPNDRWLVTADEHAVTFWELPKFQQVHQVDIDGQRHLAFSPKGDWLAMGNGELRRVISSGDGKVRLASDESEGIRRINYGVRGGTLAFDSTGRFLAVASDDVRVWRVDDGKEVSRTGQRAKALAFSPDGHFLVTGNEDGTIGRWALGIEAGVYLKHNKGVNQIGFSPNGQWLATACDDGMTHVFDVNTQTEVAKLNQGEKVSAVAFLSGERYLVTISSDTVRVFETGDRWREVAQMTHKEQTIIRAALSPDGKLLSTWSKPISSSSSKWTESQTVWDWVTGRPIAEAFQDYESGGGRHQKTRTLLRDTAEGVTAEAPKWREVRMSRAASDPKSSDGLWSASFNGRTVLLKEVITGRQIHEIELDGRLSDVVFSPDGRWLAIASDAGIVHLWPLGRDDMIREACARLPRNLSRKEREKYLGDPYSADTCSGLSVPENK